MTTENIFIGQQESFHLRKVQVPFTDINLNDWKFIGGFLKEQQQALQLTVCL